MRYLIVVSSFFFFFFGPASPSEAKFCLSELSRAAPPSELRYFPGWFFPTDTMSAHYTTDSQILLLRSRTDTLYSWESGTSRLSRFWPTCPHRKLLVISPHGNWAAVLDPQGWLRVRSMALGDEQTPWLVFPPPKDKIVNLNFSPDERYLGAGLIDGSLAMWKVPSGAPVFESQPRATDGLTHPPVICEICFSPKGNAILTTSFPSTGLTAWERPPRWKDRTWYPGPLREAVFSPNGTQVAVTFGTEVRVLDFPRAEVKARFFVEKASILMSLAFHPQGQYLAGMLSQGEVRIWDITRREIVARLIPPENGRSLSRALAFSPDGSQLVAGALVWQLQP